jgi:hypothetical protein
MVRLKPRVRQSLNLLLRRSLGLFRLGKRGCKKSRAEARLYKIGESDQAVASLFAAKMAMDFIADLAALRHNAHETLLHGKGEFS